MLLSRLSDNLELHRGFSGWGALWERTWSPPAGYYKKTSKSIGVELNNKGCLPHWPPCWSDHCRAMAWMQKRTLGGVQRRRSSSGRCWCERSDGLCHPSCRHTTTHQPGAVIVFIDGVLQELKYYLQDSLSKSSPIQVYGWTATRLDTSTSWTSWVEASTISLELACGGKKEIRKENLKVIPLLVRKEILVFSWKSWSCSSTGAFAQIRLYITLADF